jgi:flagellar P-ring protein precursor FlgI
MKKRKHDILIVLLVFGLTGSFALAQTRVRDIARPLGERTNYFEGMGLVTGLNGTGDGDDALGTLRPMVELHNNMGNPVNIEDLDGGNIALVLISARISHNGARNGDQIDVQVQSTNGAKSLKGGRLFATPLRSNSHLDNTVYAMAEGLVTIPNDEVPTAGLVKGGAIIETDIFYNYITQYDNREEGGYFTLVLDDEHANFQVARIVRMEIEAEFAPPGDAIASAAHLPQVYVQDPKNIQITIPPSQLDKAPMLIARVMDLPIELPLPEAKVVVNQRTKTIAITGNVEIAPVVVYVDGLTITVINPEPRPNPQQPQVSRSEWASFDTHRTENVKLNDLISALDRLNVSAQGKINAIFEIKRASCLLARLITEE